MNYIIAFIIVIFIIVLGMHIYTKNKVDQYYQILEEIKDKKLGCRTIRYIDKEIINIEYILKKGKSKFKVFPILEQAYIHELNLLKKLSINKDENLLDNELEELKIIIQTKLTSNIIARF
ncbi:hypothetical protein [Clostridium botulinum]|uniref:hypothetical protein n=1 Tax=Clostridium botulinum TaxID=1491 RepID=UPI0004D00FDA|nr:hypothetical protein [Clostridium botulinum]